MKPKTWAYGVTTTVERLDTLLPLTLASLEKAGFDNPRLFVDGWEGPTLEFRPFNLEITTHYPAVRTFGNWILALWELNIRQPQATYYALFQDDFVTYPNLREYLEKSGMPEQGYCNLLTFMDNEDLVTKKAGWIQSHQMGRGAVALVFNREAILALLAQPHLASKPRVSGIGHYKKIDGSIVEAMRQAGFPEYIHSPSLVQHTGDKTSIGNNVPHKAKSFRGEDFDSLQLLKE